MMKTSRWSLDEVNDKACVDDEVNDEAQLRSTLRGFKDLQHNPMIGMHQTQQHRNSSNRQQD